MVKSPGAVTRPGPPASRTHRAGRRSGRHRRARTPRRHRELVVDVDRAAVVPVEDAQAARRRHPATLSAHRSRWQVRRSDRGDDQSPRTPPVRHHRGQSSAISGWPGASASTYSCQRAAPTVSVYQGSTVSVVASPQRAAPPSIRPTRRGSTLGVRSGHLEPALDADLPAVDARQHETVGSAERAGHVVRRRAGGRPLLERDVGGHPLVRLPHDQLLDGVRTRRCLEPPDHALLSACSQLQRAGGGAESVANGDVVRGVAEGCVVHATIVTEPARLGTPFSLFR